LGVWRGADEFLAGRRFRRFEPSSSEAERRRRREGWQRAVATTLAWARWRWPHWPGRRWRYC